MITDEFVHKILEVRKRNKPKDSSSDLWKWCQSFQDRVEFNANNLESMAVNGICHGMLNPNCPVQNRQALVLLSECVGASWVRNPEGGQFSVPLVNCENLNDDEVFDRIESVVKFPVRLPGFTGGCVSSQTSRGIYTDRHCHALCVALSIARLFPNRDAAICEVGAGIGILGYMLNSLGYHDYTIFDLANANVCQAYFIGRNIDSIKIIMSGEEHEPLSASNRQSIKVLHASEFASAQAGRFDLMVNTDSMTEIPYEDAKAYVDSQCAKSLLSINHEQNSFRVKDIVTQKKLQWRYPFWVRPGYVEEFFHV